MRFELIHLDGYEVELDPFCEVLQIVEGEGAVVLLVAEEEDAEVSEIEGEILVGVDFQHLGEDEVASVFVFVDSLELLVYVFEDAGVKFVCGVGVAHFIFWSCI